MICRKRRGCWRWRESLRDGTAFDAAGAANVQVVAKAKIAESGEYNLSGDRYVHICQAVTHYDLLPIDRSLRH